MIHTSEFERLFQLALKARENAYAPYSNFQVGVSLLTNDGQYFSGCNVENAAYPSSVCAEVNAITSMVTQGSRKIAAILILGGDADHPCSPCGNCRQVLAEFATSDTTVHLCHAGGIHQTLSFKELLPVVFQHDTKNTGR